MQFDGVEIDLTVEQVSNMTGPNLRAEIAKRWTDSETIAKKHSGGVVLPEHEADWAQTRKLLAEVSCLESRSSVVDEAEAIARRRQRALRDHQTPSEYHRQPEPDDDERQHRGRPRSIGESVTASVEYKTLISSGGIAHQVPPLSVPLGTDWSMVAAAKAIGREIKALVTSNDASGGGFVVADRLTGPTELTRGGLQFLDVLPTIQTTSDLIEWVEQTSRTNNAAPVAEATATSGVSGEKPESAVAWAVQQRGVETIATWIPTTKRILADASMLRSAIDDELLYMVREELEEQTITGNGASPNLLGLNNWPNIQTGAAGANPADSIFNAAMQVQILGGVPATVAVVNVAGASALRLMRENAASGTYGGYLFGPPNQPGPMNIFGLDVAMAPAVPANTAFVLNATPTTLALVEREGANVSTGWIDRQFIRNMLTLLAELRALLIVRRPKGIYKLTGMP